MARTAELQDFVEAQPKTGERRLKGLARLWRRFVWAREAHALLRIEREASFLLDDIDFDRIKDQHLARKPE